MNELDPDLQFIFAKLTKDINFLVYHKPINCILYTMYTINL